MTSWRRNYVDPWADSTPVPEYLPLREANQRARTAFWRGAVFGAVLAAVAFVASAAWAGDTADFGGTGCTLVPVVGEAHVAEVRCRNVETSGQSLVTADLTAGGMSVNLVILHGPGSIPDRFTVTPEPGYFVEPFTLILDEWTDGVIRVFQFVGA